MAVLFTWPFYRAGYFPTHDGEWAIVRLTEMVRELKDLQIPPRWSTYLNHGFGYPLFSFTYPLPYYLGALLKFFGLSYTWSIKSLFLFSVFASVFFMYLLAKELVGKLGAVMASMLYTIMPYRLVNLYQRGNLGESLSLAFFPLIFYLALLLKKKSTKTRAILLSVSIVSLILTHNISALLFIPFSAVFLFLIRIPPRQIFFVLLLGFSLSLYFTLPALRESGFLYLSGISLADKSRHFLDLGHLLNLVKQPGVDLYLGLGILPLLLFAAAAIFLAGFKKIKRLLKIQFAFFMAAVLLLIFMSTKYSVLFWQLPFLKTIDFPWRVMTPLIFFTSLFITILALKRSLLLTGLVVVLVAAFYNFGFVKLSGILNKSDQYYLTNDATTTSMDELMPLWVKIKAKNRPQLIAQYKNSEDAPDIWNTYKNSREISFNIANNDPAIIKLNQLYYPGWKFFINGAESEVKYTNPQGVSEIALPAGQHAVRGIFRETPLRLFADLISLVSLFYAVYLIIKEKIKFP